MYLITRDYIEPIENFWELYSYKNKEKLFVKNFKEIILQHTKEWIIQYLEDFFDGMKDIEKYVERVKTDVVKGIKKLDAESIEEILSNIGSEYGVWDVDCVTRLVSKMLVDKSLIPMVDYYDRLNNDYASVTIHICEMNVSSKEELLAFLCKHIHQNPFTEAEFKTLFLEKNVS